MKANMKKDCNDCGAEINIPSDAMVGEVITCPDCGANFEITEKSEQKIEVKPAESIGEDWGQ
jgi:alpha-aminoadipate/glutamate carrier protein LysW